MLISSSNSSRRERKLPPGCVPAIVAFNARWAARSGVSTRCLQNAERLALAGHAVRVILRRGSTLSGIASQRILRVVVGRFDRIDIEVFAGRQPILNTRGLLAHDTLV